MFSLTVAPTSTPRPTTSKRRPAPPRSKASKEISTSTSRKSPPSNYPDGSKQKYNYPQLEETYNELRNERTALSAELGELIKPVNEQKAKAGCLCLRAHGEPDALAAHRPAGQDRGVDPENPADQCAGSQHRGPLRVLPHGHSRAGQADRGGDVAEGQEAGRVRARVHQSSRARTVEDT